MNKSVGRKKKCGVYKFLRYFLTNDCVLSREATEKRHHCGVNCSENSLNFSKVSTSNQPSSTETSGRETLQRTTRVLVSMKNIFQREFIVTSYLVSRCSRVWRCELLRSRRVRSRHRLNVRRILSSFLEQLFLLDSSETGMAKAQWPLPAVPLLKSLVNC